VRGPLAAFLALFLGGVAQASVTLVDARVVWENRKGYTPVVVRVQATDAQDLELVATCDGEPQSSRSRLLTVPGRGVETTLLMPPQPAYAYCGVRVDWKAADGTAGSTRALSGMDVGVVRIDPENDFPPYDHIHSIVSISASQLPDRWQAYPPGGTVLLSAAGERQLAPAQADAILRWARAGGRLIVSTEEQFRAWQPNGAVNVRISRVDDAVLEVDSEAFDPPLEPVPGTSEVPAEGFMLLAFGFALLVGPVNLWWVLKRKRARHLLLVTTPLLSLATCLLLVGYGLVAEGVDTKRQVTELTWLDTDRHEAVAWHGVSYFAPFPPSEFVVPSEALVSSINPGDFGNMWDEGFQTDPPKTLAWQPEGQLIGAWIPARRNYRLTYVIPRPERRRLEVRVRPDGRPEVENGLGVGIRWIELQLGEPGQWAIAGPIAPGATVLMEIAQSDRRSEPNDLLTLGPSAREVWRVARSQPGHFAAELEAPLASTPGPESVDAGMPHAYLAGRIALMEPDAKEAP
jgi:hypothetical protein